jgi:predicted Zn-dependent peptidase
MSVIFGDEGGSRLFWDLVDSGLAEYAVTGTYEYQGSGITMAFMSCDPEDAEDNRKRLIELQQEIEEDGVEPEELELARSKVCSQVVRRAERPSNRLFSVGSGWLQRGSYMPVKDAVAAYKAVTAEDIAATLKAFPMSKGVTVMAGPVSGGQG